MTTTIIANRHTFDHTPIRALIARDFARRAVARLRGITVLLTRRVWALWTLARRTFAPVRSDTEWCAELPAIASERGTGGVDTLWGYERKAAARCARYSTGFTSPYADTIRAMRAQLANGVA